MNTKFFRSLANCFASFGFFFLLTQFTFAIGIQPIRHEVNLDPGDSTTGEIKVINETESDFSAEPVLKAFYKNDETGFPVYPTEEDLEIENVLEWVTLPTEPVFIPAGESRVVEYTINVPESAEAGGKYMTIAYQPVKESEVGVSVNVRAASLLFINVTGDIIRQGEITYFGLPEEIKTDEPFYFELTFENTGNTHVKPHGWIKLIDKTTGEQLKSLSEYIDEETTTLLTGGEIPVNLRQKNVLPGSIRTFKAEWANHLKEGSFEAVVDLEYDRQAGSISQTLDFEIKEELSVDEFEISTNELSADFDLTLTNHGNAHERPMGRIDVTNNLGYQVAEIEIPENIDYLAPGETRSFTFPWLNKAIPAGRYTAALKASYGFTNKPLEAEVSFGEMDRSKLYLGIGLGVAILVALMAIFTKKRKD